MPVAGLGYPSMACCQVVRAVGLPARVVVLARRQSVSSSSLTVIAARERDRHTDQALIPLTLNEIRRLFSRLITNTIRTIDHWLHWSAWRRRHQASAKTSHYRRRGHLIHQPTST
jgi:hypothetical protein